MVPHGLKEGDLLATPTGIPFEVPRGATPGCAMKVPLVNPLAANLPTATAAPTAILATNAPPPAYSSVAGGEMLEAQCRKQHPVMGVWLERWGTIEGKSLKFYDKKPGTPGGETPTSSVDDITGCGVSMGREKFTFDGNQYLITLERKGHPTGLPDLEDAGLLRFCFKAEEDCAKFNAALQILGCQIVAAPATAVTATIGGVAAAAVLKVGRTVQVVPTATPAALPTAVPTASVLRPAAATAMKYLLGSKLETAGGKTVVTADALAGKKYIGIYFSGGSPSPKRAMIFC